MEEAKQAGVFVSCDDIGVKNARACGKMITNNYFGGRWILCVEYLYGIGNLCQVKGVYVSTLSLVLR